MALQQAQLLLNMSSLEQVNFGVHQNNTEAFAVALCHLAELHAEQVVHPGSVWLLSLSYILISQLDQPHSEVIKIDRVRFPAPKRSSVVC